MNIFKKVRDIFYDDVEEEIDLKETKKQDVVETKKPIAKEIEPKQESHNFHNLEETKKVLTNDLDERNLYQSKDTFQFPVFDEKDFETTLNRKRTTNVMDYQSRRVVPEIGKKEEEPKKEEKKVFRPSPVISPIYGILDKNYTKEEIVDRKDLGENSIPKTDLSYDSVRRKAYGTLEDDLEDTLMTINKSTISGLEEIENELDSIEDPKRHIESLLNELERTASLTVGEIEEALKNQLEDEEEPKVVTSEFDEDLVSRVSQNLEDLLEETTEFKPKKEEVEIKDEKKLENDLFNLIDSMYEGDEK